MTCGDVYTLAAPSGCGNVWAFPSVVHPTPPVSSGGGQFRHRPYIVEPEPNRQKKREDDLWVVLLHQNLLD